MCTQSYNFHLRAESKLHIKLFDFTLQALLVTVKRHRCVEGDPVTRQTEGVSQAAGAAVTC